MRTVAGCAEQALRACLIALHTSHFVSAERAMRLGIEDLCGGEAFTLLSEASNYPARTLRRCPDLSGETFEGAGAAASTAASSAAIARSTSASAT